MRLIDADELAKEIESFSCWVTAWNEYPELAREIVSQMKKSTAELVREAPTVDAVPKGKWIEENGIQICPFCGEEHEWEDYRASFCDQCGADLRGGKE